VSLDYRGHGIRWYLWVTGIWGYVSVSGFLELRDKLV
jgi:hypothetical protein